MIVVGDTKLRRDKVLELFSDLLAVQFRPSRLIERLLYFFSQRLHLALEIPGFYRVPHDDHCPVLVLHRSERRRHLFFFSPRVFERSKILERRLMERLLSVGEPKNKDKQR
jgi:hypothetical protein